MPDVIRDSVSCTWADGLATITLTQPERGNPVDVPFATDINEVVLELSNREDETRAILLRGEGPNFSYGGDLKMMMEHFDHLERLCRDLTFTWHNALAHFWRLDIPIVAEVQGYCMGGACSWVAGCDVVVAAESAKFGSAFANIGISCDSGHSPSLTFRMGPGRARRFALLSEIVDSAEALRSGLADFVVPDAELSSTALKYAQKFANGPTAAYAADKRLFRMAANIPFEELMVAESREVSSAIALQDAHECIRAMVEKRKPVCTGRRDVKGDVPE